MKNIINKLLLLALAILISGLAWLLGSNSGLKWLIAQASQIAPVQIEYAELKGSLWSDIQFQALSVKLPGQTLQIDQGELRVNVSPLLTGRLDIIKLHSGNVVLIQTAPTPTAQTETDITAPGLKLPLRISIGDLAVGNFDLQQQFGAQQVFQSLTLTNAKLGRSLKYELLAFERKHLKLSSEGDIPLNGLEPINVDINAVYDINDRLPNVPVNINASGVYPLIEISSSSPDPLNVESKTLINFSNLNAIEWNSSVQAKDVDLSDFNIGMLSQIHQVQGKLQGKLKRQEIAQVKIDIDAKLSKTLPSLEENLDLNVSAELKNRQWHIHSLDIAQTKLPGKLHLSGTIATDFAFNADTRGEFDIQTQQWNWPVQNTILSTQQSRIKASGSASAYQYEWNGDLTAADNVLTAIKAKGSGDIHEIRIDDIALNYLQGDWTGKGKCNWSSELYWQASLAPVNADISQLPYSATHDFISKLSGQLQHEGGFHDGKLYIRVSASKLQGLINQKAVDSSLDFRYENDSLYFSNINLKNKATRIEGDLIFSALRGDTGIESHWRIKSSDINSLYPDLHGRITSTGQISGKLASPSASLSLSANNIRHKDIRVDNIKVSLIHDAAVGKTSKLNADLSDIRVLGQTVPHLSLNGYGSLEDHSIKTDVTLPTKNRFSFRVNGGWIKSAWLAEISQTELTKDGKPNWIQPKTANIKISAEESSVQNYCLSRVNSVDRLCVLNAGMKAQQTHVKGKIENINLHNLLPRIANNLNNIEGKLSGDIELILQPQHPQLQTQVFVAGASIDLSAYNPQLPILHFEKFNIKGKTVKGNFVGSAQATISEQGELIASWQLDHLQSLLQGSTNNNISANLDLTLNKLDLIPEFIPDAQNVSGTWHNTLIVSGTLDSPQYSADSKIQVAKLSIPRLGIQPVPLSLALSSDREGKVTFAGSTKSGDGEIALSGSLPRIGNFLSGIEMRALGEKYQLVDLPEAKMKISPNIVMTVDQSGIALNGAVTIPYARIKLFDTGKTVSLSSDVKIVGEEQNQSKPLEFEANLYIELGDDIRIDTSGLKGKLEGSLNIIEKTGSVTSANGELTIKDGSYSAYGRELNIEEGKFIFSSSPLENPGLRIKAVAKTSNKDVVAGIKVTGSARTPIVTLFSEPAMDQSDILAYIVLGYPINQASKEEGELLAKAATSIGFLGGEKIIRSLTEQFGLDEVKIQSSNTTKEASLVLGKYLSPKLYVQYAVGIGDTVNSMMLDYKVNKQISIKSESGESQSTDIIFSIEKD